ncbi:hypothetical protein HK101_007826 [Irineochytrium annulatum]|nr:hypothetical protein HK101_007826 [Irineochytrium annulatum]
MTSTSKSSSMPLTTAAVKTTAAPVDCVTTATKCASDANAALQACSNSNGSCICSNFQTLLNCITACPAVVAAETAAGGPFGPNNQLVNLVQSNCPGVAVPTNLGGTGMTRSGADSAKSVGAFTFAAIAFALLA